MSARHSAKKRPPVLKKTLADSAGQFRKTANAKAAKELTANQSILTPLDDSGELASTLAKFKQSQTGDTQEHGRGENTHSDSISDGLCDVRALPRPDRRRKRARADRGLPADVELARLAGAYLTCQRSLWPELAAKGLLALSTPEILCDMVEDFKERHRTGKCALEIIQKYKGLVAELGGSYSRYSCENSSPTSIIDQLTNELSRAQKDQCFIPWCYVFGDYSISGLDSSRQGYTSYKATLADPEHAIKTTYVDDFTRASRDEIEWWQLAALCKKLGKGMIGASDGFNLADPNSDILMTMYGLVSRLFVKGLREKVRRGMKGAASRGGCLGKLPLGFTKRIQRDSEGNPILQSDGSHCHERCIDPATEGDAKLLFRLFTVDRLTPYKIVRRFNELKVDGWAGWTESTLKKLLANPAFIGVVIWNQTHREFDWESEQWVVLPNPKSEWNYEYDPELAIISQDQWFEARKRLADMRNASPLTGRKLSRNQISATTLFSGTLLCGYCTHENKERELTLTRSTGNNKSMFCPNGPNGMHGCELSTSKSTRIIEECILAYIRNSIFTEDALQDLVIKANAYLKQQASKPHVDTLRLRAAARKEESVIAKLVGRIERAESDELIAVYEQQITTRRKNLDRIRREIAEAESQNAAPPALLDLARVKVYMSDLRELLNQRIPAAAEAIRALTGKILIRQEATPGRPGARWIATFSPQLLKILAATAKKKDYPDSLTLELLYAANWIAPEQIELAIAKVIKYEQLGPVFKQLYEAGAGLRTIAAAYDMPNMQAAQILHFGLTGERPRWPKKKDRKRAKTSPGRHAIPLYLQIFERVVSLHDGERLTFSEICRRLNAKGIIVSYPTVVRAYDHGHSRDALAPVELGRKHGR